MTPHSLPPDSIDDLLSAELNRLQMQELFCPIEDDLARLLDDAAGGGLSKLTEWDLAILGLCLSYVVNSLLLPERTPAAHLEPSRN